MKLSLGAIALIVRLALVFEALSQHLHLFFDLPLASRPPFSFIVATFFARRLPTLEHSSHLCCLVNYYHNNKFKQKGNREFLLTAGRRS
jgi:hypothetical protein